MKKIIAIVTLAILLLTVSCAPDILDQTPTDQFTDAQVWQDEFLIESHLAELYAMSVFMVNDAVAIFSSTSPLNVDFSGAANWNFNLGVSEQGEGPIHTTTIADEAKYSERGAQTNYHTLKLYGMQRSGSTLRWWSNGYYLNRQLNHFIENVADSPLSNAKEAEAEARFL
ncbi:MAG: RagB/SusD family nutrient uptake outer membrane protein, partial [Bacteroidales bacterium]|nr:RagB/SusD family nutrient uptake outer membrane protein [Bacteroidales bacterium]